MKLVTVAIGYSAVPILGNLYNQGQQIVLTDDQYNALPAAIKSQLSVRSTGPDRQPTPPSPYANQSIETALLQAGVPIFLVWDGSTYQPNNLIGALDRPKTFIGPQDPNAVAGASLAIRDQWINY
jgi:hypothetical protein